MRVGFHVMRRRSETVEETSTARRRTGEPGTALTHRYQSESIRGSPGRNRGMAVASGGDSPSDTLHRGCRHDGGAAGVPRRPSPRESYPAAMGCADVAAPCFRRWRLSVDRLVPRRDALLAEFSEQRLPGSARCQHRRPWSRRQGDAGDRDGVVLPRPGTAPGHPDDGLGAPPFEPATMRSARFGTSGSVSDDRSAIDSDPGRLTETSSRSALSCQGLAVTKPAWDRRVGRFSHEPPCSRAAGKLTF